MHVGSETWDVICRRGEGWGEGGGGNWGERMVKDKARIVHSPPPPSSSFSLLPLLSLLVSIDMCKVYTECLTMQ